MNRASQLLQPLQAKTISGHTGGAPPVYNPFKQHQPIQQKSAAGWVPGTAPPVYRPGTANVPALQGRAVQKRPETGSKPGNPASPGYLVQAPVQLADGRQRVRVTAAGAGAVGSVMLTPLQGRKIYISQLEVSPEYRRQGVGTLLMRAALQTAQIQGRSSALLEAAPEPLSLSPQSLISMYQKLGFRQTGLSPRGKPLMEYGTSHSLQAKAPIQPKMMASPAAALRLQSFSIQRSAMEIEDLEKISVGLNESHSGKSDSRNVQATVVTEDDTVIVVSQREYSSFDEVIESAESEYNVTINDRVIGDGKNDEGIHAEMLAISWWLQGNIKKPKKIGVSQGICARCQAVLDHFDITSSPAGGHYTKNWVHPYRHAYMAKAKVPVKLQKLPQKVTRGKEYSW